MNILILTKNTYLNKNTVDLLKKMKTNLRITRFVMFCISIYVLIPNIADCTVVFGSVTANSFNASSSDSSTTSKVNPQDLKDIYVPPNYGSPDSQYGSGTR